MLLNCSVGKEFWESLGLQEDPTSPFERRSVLGVHWKDWCWSWNSNTLATSCEELTHWKRPWCWEGLGAGGEGDDRGWDGWMASLTQWTWAWVNSGSLWWTGRPGMLRFMGSQRIRHDWETELNWTRVIFSKYELIMSFVLKALLLYLKYKPHHIFLRVWRILPFSTWQLHFILLTCQIPVSLASIISYIIQFLFTLFPRGFALFFLPEWLAPSHPSNLSLAITLQIDPLF